MSEQCPHIVGMSWCEQCAEERIAELEAEVATLRKAGDYEDRFNAIYPLIAENEKLREANDVCTLHCMEITGHLDKLREDAQAVVDMPLALDHYTATERDKFYTLAAALEVDDE